MHLQYSFSLCDYQVTIWCVPFYDYLILDGALLRIAVSRFLHSFTPKTPVAAGCTQLPIGRIGCDMDWDSYACRVCETAQTREPGYWLSYEVYNGLNDPAETLHFEDEVELQSFAKYGLCGWTIRDAKAAHSGGDSFEHCKTVTHEDVEDENILPRRKPSIGADGRFCVCVKPTELEMFDVPKGAIEEKKIRIREQRNKKEDEEKLKAMVEEVDPSEMLTKLYQSDFDKGTFRITRPGIISVFSELLVFRRETLI